MSSWSFSVCRLCYCIIYGVGMSSWSFSVCRLCYCIIYGVEMSSWSFSVCRLCYCIIYGVGMSSWWSLSVDTLLYHNNLSSFFTYLYGIVAQRSFHLGILVPSIFKHSSYTCFLHVQHLFFYQL
jgi:hypothetical protein